MHTPSAVPMLLLVVGLLGWALASILWLAGLPTVALAAAFGSMVGLIELGLTGQWVDGLVGRQTAAWKLGGYTVARVATLIVLPWLGLGILKLNPTGFFLGLATMPIGLIAKLSR